MLVCMSSTWGGGGFFFSSAPEVQNLADYNLVTLDFTTNKYWYQIGGEGFCTYTLCSLHITVCTLPDVRCINCIAHLHSAHCALTAHSSLCTHHTRCMPCVLHSIHHM